MVEESSEQPVLARLLELRAGGLGIVRVHRALGAAGVLNPRTGRPWSLSVLRKVLKTAERRSA